MHLIRASPKHKYVRHGLLNKHLELSHGTFRRGGPTWGRVSPHLLKNNNNNNNLDIKKKKKLSTLAQTI